MTRWKASFAVILALSMIWMAACSNNSNSSSNSNNNSSNSGESGSNTTSNSNNNTAEPPETKAQFSYYLWNETKDILENSKQWETIKERAGVEIELIDGGPRDSAYYQGLDLMFAAGDLPDTLSIRIEQAYAYGKQGALLDLKPLIDEHAPNIAAYFQENPAYERQILTAEGQIFGLFHAASPVPSASWIFRKDWADKLNLKYPETLDEFTQFLRDLKAANPGNNTYFYPLTTQVYNHLNRGFANVFGIPSHDDYLDVFSPNYREFIEYLHMLYEEKLFDPESARGSISEDALKAKMLNGDAAVFFRGLPNAEDMTLTGRALNPELEFTALRPLEPVHGDLRGYWGSSGGFFPQWSMSISSQAEDPVSIIKFFDFIFSDEGQELKHWGIEGESYVIENGKKKYLVTMEEILAYQPGTRQNNWVMVHPGTYTIPSPNNPEAAIALQSEFMQGLIAIVKDYTIPSPRYALTPEDKARVSDLEAVINPKLESWIIGFVIGDKDFSEWDAFLDDMRNLGREEMLELIIRSRE